MNERNSQLAQKFQQMEHAYRKLAEGAETLLQLASVFWTEALLLKLVRYLYRHRLQQIRGIVERIPDELK